MGRDRDVLVIIPAYNEGSSLKKIVGRVKKSLPEADVLVVNDSSSDNTAQAAWEAGAVVLTHPFNMGYGAGLQTGYKYAQQHDYHYILQMDADGQHEPEYLRNIFKELASGNADVVIGSRFLHKDSYHPPFCRRMGMKFFSFLAYVIIRQRIIDPTSGFQGFDRKVLGFLVSDYFPVDYPDADVIVMLHRHGFRIKEIPVVMRASEGKSMHSGLKPVYYIFKMLLSLFVTFLRKKKIQA